MVWGTYSIMGVIWGRILASRMAVHIPHPIQNPWRLPWQVISAVSLCLMIPVLAFHSISTNPILVNSFPYPFDMSTTALQAHVSSKDPSQNSTCMSLTTFSQFVTSGSSSRIASRSHWKGCYGRICKGPPNKFRCRRLTTSVIFCLPGN